MGLTSDSVRVTVAAATQRADLVLPAALPVAELVPGLARAVGLLDGTTAYGGFRLSTTDGRPLRADAGLVDQGVRHGHVLILVAAVDDPDPLRYDDEAEAMADVTSEVVAAGDTPDAGLGGRRTGWAVVCACSAVGLAAALVAGPGRITLTLLAGTAVVLAVVAAVLSRSHEQDVGPVLVACLSCAQAAGAGALIGSGGPASERLTGAGAAMLLAGAAGAAGLAVGRLFLLPPIVVGAVLLAAGLAARGLAVQVGFVVTVLLTTVTVAAERLPSLALAAAAGRDPSAGRHVDEPVDLARVRSWARAADRVHVAGSASVATLLVVAAPYAVTAGLAGTLGSVLCCVVVLLRARSQRDPVRAVDRAGGLLGLLATAVSVLCLQPDWRSAAAATLYVVGAGSLARVLGARPDPLVVDRLCEVTRSAALLALPSTLLVASGALPVLAR